MRKSGFHRVRLGLANAVLLIQLRCEQFLRSGKLPMLERLGIAEVLKASKAFWPVMSKALAHLQPNPAPPAGALAITATCPHCDWTLTCSGTQPAKQAAEDELATHLFDQHGIRGSKADELAKEDVAAAPLDLTPGQSSTG